MIEHLGPNMARSILGNAYNPDFRYELATDDEGFHVMQRTSCFGVHRTR